MRSFDDDMASAKAPMGFYDTADERSVEQQKKRDPEFKTKLMHKLEGINRLPYMLDYRYSTPSAPIPCEVHCIPEACPCVAVDDFARVKPKAADPANVAKWKKLQSDSRGTFGQRLRAGRRGRLYSAV